MTKGNTKRSERVSKQVYFTLAENEQIEAILGGMEFSRWVRAKLAEEAAKQGKAFNNDLPEKGKYKRNSE
jgi:hypothetical protein